MKRSAAVFSMLLLVARAARADEPPKPEPSPSQAEDEQTKRLASEKGRLGMSLYRAEDYEGAYSSFRDANELFHTPQLVLYMARCQEKRRKLLEARALYERVLSEPLPEAPSESLLRARQAAMTELGPMRLRIPTLAIDVRGPPPTEVTVFVDGEVWPLGEPLEIDPGGHEIEAIAQSGARTSRTMELPEGRSVSTVLRLGLFAKNPVLPNDFFAAPVEPFPQWRLGLAGGGFTLGVVGLGLGITAGIVAVKQKAIVDELCFLKECSKEGFEAAQRAWTFATLCDVSLALAAVGTATGIAALVLKPSPNTPLQAGLAPLGRGALFFAGGAF